MCIVQHGKLWTNLDFVMWADLKTDIDLFNNIPLNAFKHGVHYYMCPS